jgi:BRCT domain type II-containing protein
VVVRAKIEVDQTTAALTITSDTTGPYRIPTIIDGIPLQIKHVNVLINRSNFTFNPTNCDRMAITGNLTSAEGAVHQLLVPFQATNCATLEFEPQRQWRC